MDYTQLSKELLNNMKILRNNKSHREAHGYLKGSSHILQYLYHNPNNVLPSSLSNEMCISTARIAAALNNLEEKGLITRKINPSDRRQVLVELTEAGVAEAKRQYQLACEKVADTLRSVGDHDANELVRIIGKIANIAEIK